jgi:outer membrane protein assembly factor BamB
MNYLKLAILIIFIILSDFQYIHSQPINFAVITEPLIGSKNSETNLKSIVDQINVRKDLDFVVIFGNVSSDGSFQLLNTADNILTKLKIPYYVSPGINDISKADNGGIDYFQSIGSDGFSFTFGNKIFLSINPALPFNTYLHRINVDEIKWISDFITSSGLNSLLLFSPVAPDKIQNNENLRNILSKVDTWLIFCGSDDQYKREKYFGSELISLPALSGKELSYNTIKIENDTIYIFRQSVAEKSDLLIDMLNISTIDIEPIEKKVTEIFSDNIIINEAINFNETHLAEASYNDGLINTASKNGTIKAIDTRGNLKWEYYTGGTMFHAPVRYRDLLAATIFESDLITLNANNGELIQVMGLSENISAPPVLIDIRHNGYDTKGVIVSTVSGNIFCYELFSFELVWSQKNVKGRISSIPLQEKSMVIFCNSKGEVFALNSDNGTLVWKYMLGTGNQKYLNLAGPVTDGRNVYVLYEENILTALDLLQGTQRWVNSELPHQHSMIVKDDKHILVKGKDNNYFLISSADGKLIRSFPSLSRNYFPNNFVLTDNFILNGNSEGDIVMIDNNQNVSQLFNSFSAPVVSINAIDENSFVSLDLDGNLIFFDIKQTMD